MKWIIALFPLSVMAAQYDAGWDIPTSRVDGVSLELSEISHYEMWVDDVLVVDNIPPEDTVIRITVESGTRCIKMRTEDTEGRVGPFSDAVCKEVRGSPNAPSIISIDFAGD